MLLHCNDPDCLAATSIIAVDTAGDVGLDPSLALDAAGNPVVAYLDGPRQDLKLLHCRTPDCTQPTAPKPTPSPVATPATTPTPAALAGDADCSAAVDAIDAALILQFTADLVDSLPCPGGADANGDGLVNSIDSALVLQLVAGLIPGLPP